MRKKPTTTLHTKERKWFFIVLSAIVCMFILYAYFLSLSVVHVVMRKEVTQEITEVKSYVSELETEYISAQHAVSRSIASRNGYAEVEEPIFIDRAPSSLVLVDLDEG